MKKLVLLFVLGFVAMTSYAQTPIKIGYADPDYILGQLPEFKQIENELKTHQTALKNQVDAKYAEFQKKLKDYQDNINTMLAPVRENTERELQQLQQNLEKLQQDAQTSIQNKSTLLMQPVYLKVNNAIEGVAKENGYNLVLTSQVSQLDVVLYADESLDISDLVLKKLGVTPKPPETAAPATTPAKPK
jgi:outer membrane protein